MITSASALVFGCSVHMRVSSGVVGQCVVGVTSFVSRDRVFLVTFFWVWVVWRCILVCFWYFSWCFSSGDRFVGVVALVVGVFLAIVLVVVWISA